VPLSRNLGTLTSWNPLGPSRPVTGLLYPFFYAQLYSSNKLRVVYDYTILHTCIDHDSSAV
jgi:hypothetical protein